MLQERSAPHRTSTTPPMRRAAALVLLLSVLAACRTENAKREEAPTPAAPRAALATGAAEASLRSRLRAPEGELRQRGVQVFEQARRGTFAVCGRAASTGTAGDPFLPYVAVVSFEDGTPRVTDFVLGITGPEATRVFIEMVDRCFEGGGSPAARAIVRALPPLPDTRPVERMLTGSMISIAASTPAETLRPVEALRPADPMRGEMRSVVTTPNHGANIRMAPQSGEVVRVAPRATRLEVLGEAPGGWFQVGQDGVAWGWVHRSVLDPSSVR